MPPETVSAWLAAMKAAGLARSDAACARLLGITPRALLDIKKAGTADRRTALACTALLHELGPYGAAENAGD